jgi:hypothetical protein
MWRNKISLCVDAGKCIVIANVAMHSEFVLLQTSSVVIKLGSHNSYDGDFCAVDDLTRSTSVACAVNIFPLVPYAD